MNLPLMFLLVSFAFVSGPMHGQSARQPHLAGPADVVRQYCDFDVKIGRISTDNFQSCRRYALGTTSPAGTE